ncbi:MAG: hypothetical protein QGH45_00095 [Myxococcota bacterium]|nr:hypothetical protein [Myxococcota bacterium]
MTRIWIPLLALTSTLALAPLQLAHAEPHVVGVYTNGHAPGWAFLETEGWVYHVDARGLDAIDMGSVMVAYRRVPAERGDAAFRDDPVWMESGRLQVVGLGEGGWVVARMVAGPPFPLPAMDDDGLPRDKVCIGDRVVESGSVGPGAESVIGHFEHELLFGAGTHDLREGGSEVLRVWLSRFAVGGSVRIDVGVQGSTGGLAAPLAETHERLARTGGPDGTQRAEVRGDGDEAALAQRRAARLGRLVTEVLDLDPEVVLTTTSWPDEAVSDPNTVTIRLLDAVPRAEMAPVTARAPDGAPLAELDSAEGTR